MRGRTIAVAPARHRRAAPPLPELQGLIDEAGPNRLRGWVWDPRQPRRRIELELLLDGKSTLARATADQYRPELRDAGIGDGRYAFTIGLGKLLPPGERHVLHLRQTATGAELPGSPIVIVGQPATVDGVRAEDMAAGNGVAIDTAADGNLFGDLQGNIDVADRVGVRGWIWDAQRPERRIELELLDGDTPLATLLANEYRDDLERAGIGDGRYGFAFSFNETLLPNARHELHLRPVGSAVEVASFPRVLTNERAGFDAAARLILGNLVAEAERADKTEDLAPVATTLMRSLDTVLARYFALADRTAEDAAELLPPEEFAPQFQKLVDSLQLSYPVLHNDSDGPSVVSIVIPVYNKFELTYRCVQSIVEQGARVPFEIVVVDDASRDATMLAGLVFGRGIRLVRNAANGGFIRACNAGFDAARGDYVVFLNNDTEVRAGWLDELYETLRDDPKIGVVGAKLLFPDGTLQECGGLVWRMGDAWNWGRDEAADDPRFCYRRDVDYVSGAALMVRASLFAELGKFDEHYRPAYYEDTELCFRARQAGYRVVVQPTAEIVHHEGASAGTSLRAGMKRYQAINHRKFLARWKEALATHRFNGEMPELEIERDVRQRALFIDDSVPEPDKDAGSNAAVQHMLSLQRLGYKVSFVPADNMARLEPYTTGLQRRGIECLYHPFYPSAEDVLKRQTVPFDLVYLHRYSNAAKYAGMVRQRLPQARLVYNVADLHFLRAERQAELENDGKLREEAERLRRLELGAMSFVDCVIVHSTSEADLLRELAPQIDVRVIPWTVPLRELANGATRVPGLAFIGGYRHPPNTDAAKWAVQALMPQLRHAVPGVELLLVGSNMPPEIARLTAKDVIPLGHVPSLDSVFERVRLTIAPLRFGAGLKGKVIDSLAAGVPCVMSSIAAEGLGLPKELQSLIADEPKKVAQRIAALCRDDVEYRRIVEAGRAHVAKNYSPERIDALLREACGAD